jgi:hypothetical protein
MKPDDLSPLYHLTGSHNVKINGLEMAQNLIAPAAWALAVLNHKPSMVIEIGTSKGGMSSLISGCVKTIGSEFHTLDVHDDGDYNQYSLYGNSRFHKWDCFEHVDEIIEWMSRPGLCFLLCDGGNKPKEFNLFSQFLKVGDVIGAHDWCDETVPNYSPIYWSCSETPTARIQEAIDKNNLVDFEPSWFRYSAWCVKRKRISV